MTAVRFLSSCLLMALFATVLPAAEPVAGQWDQLPPLPDPQGFAGSFAGVHNDALIVAGGANFPDAPPWEGGQKVWHDRVFVLERPDGNWSEGGRLPRPLGYGVSLSVPAGVICIGGSDAERHHADAFLLRWEAGQLRTSSLPSLPTPCANLCGALLGETIYVAGGIEAPDSTAALSTFWSLELNHPDPQWQQLEPWPGPGRMLAVAAVQDQALYLISGAELTADAEDGPTRRYLHDVYRYRPSSGWKRIADLPRPAVAAPSPAPAVGQSSFFVLGGDDGSQVGSTTPEQHPGFAKSILAYHTVTDTWKELPGMPASHVTTSVTRWQQKYIVPSGEIRPGVRSPAVWAFAPTLQKASFGWFNYSIIVAYLIGMIGIGFVCSRRNRSTNDFFRGGQRIPWWAAGLSIFATMLSSITFMAIPAAAYTSGWNLFLANSYILITPLVVFVFLPFYRSLNVTSAYEYLELRFNYATRLLGSSLFVMFQCGRIAIVLYLPALALATVSDFDIQSCIIVMGVLCVLYTVAGGIEAVIWTDVVQAIILVGGALFSLTFLLWQIDGGLSEAIRLAGDGERFFETVDWSWDLTVASGWVILFGSLFHNLFPYTASQDVVQRYLTTRDIRTAGRGIWLNAIIAVPAQAIFFAIGTALYVFYTQHPARMEPSLQNDAIFPYFIFSELPIGVAGLLVAGIFASAQSTLSSSMNSIATAYVTDFHRRAWPDRSDDNYLVVARIATAIVGIVGSGIALLMASTDIRSIYSTFLEVIGLLGGTLSGLFILGIFSRRASAPGALLGAVVSAAVVFSFRLLSPLNVYAYAPIGLSVVVTAGWLASLVCQAESKNLNGLTIYTIEKQVA